MFPSAPEVQVYAPTTLFAGREVTVEIVVTAKEATKIEYVDARITGHQGWRISAGEHSIVSRARWPELQARLRGEGQLPAGTSKFQTRFELPALMPPSHQMAPAWAYLELFVRVAIPWWPDGKYYFSLPVRVPPPSAVERKPFAIRSTAAADAPRMELSLASTRLIAGETVVGSLAVFHLDDRKPRDVELTLVPSFRLHLRGRTRERRGPTLAVTITMPAGSAGSSLPFHFRLPADITPTFSSVTHELTWWLVAKTGSLFGKKLELDVPLEIFDASAMASVERLIAAPRLTDQRITAAFAHFASGHGWHEVAGDDREREREQLMYEREAAASHDRAGGVASGTTLRVGYVYRGEEGAFVVASVAHPWLGLGLLVTPTSRLRDMLARDIDIGVPDWDRSHHVLARWAEQTQPFLRAAVPAVIDANDELGKLLRWTDDEIVFERQVSSVEVADLARVSAALDSLASALATVAVPLPPGVDLDLEDWRKLAQRLDGRLRLGDLAIEGTLDELPVEILVGWFEDRAEHVSVFVGDVDHGLASNAAPEELFQAAPDVTGLRVVDGIASAMLGIADGRLEVARVRELVFGLRALIEKLRRPDGPYR